MGFEPDSDVHTVSDSLNGNWTFGYDDFNRVSSSNKNSGQQTFTYLYDRFSNRWQQNAPQGGPAPQYSFNANNQITGSGVQYDAAGNITNDGLGNSYTYDAEGRVTAVSGANPASYTYDALGHRVEQAVGSSARDFIFDQSGRAVTQMSPGWDRSELYAGGLHVATYINNSTYFDHSDWEGTVRALTDPTGTQVETCTGLAFGDGESCTGSNWSPLHYTGQDLDTESNLNHMQFRQYSSTQGRWTTPDPAGMAAVDPTNPQSWNRYAYVGNNPLGFVDPLGLNRCGPACVGECNADEMDCSGGLPVDEMGNFCDASGECFDDSFANEAQLMSFMVSLMSGLDDGYGSWILNFHQSITGYIVGDYNGEILCPQDLPFCTFWDERTQEWEPAESGTAANNWNPSLDPLKVAQNMRSYVMAPLPTICGGGGFGYAGVAKEFEGGEGFVGYLGEYDTKSGWSNNLLVEGGTHTVSGGAAINSHKFEPLVFIPVAEFGGLVLGTGGVGFYVGTPNLGTGGYVHVTTVATCKQGG